MRRPTILITGATDGLGRALAHRAAADGSTVLLHGRDRAKLVRTSEAIGENCGVPLPPVFVADLGELAQVRRLASEVRSATDRLDVLVSNAAIGAGEPDGGPRRVSADGYELRFAVNYLAGFLLTLELLPLLRRSAPARVVNVSSIRQRAFDFNDLMLVHHYDGGRAYEQSKLAQVMSTFEFARRVPADEVTVNSLHPATYMPTKMVMETVGTSIDSLEEGVASTYRLVSEPNLSEVTGRFFDRSRDAKANAQAYDQTARDELWKLSNYMVDLPESGGSG